MLLDEGLTKLSTEISSLITKGQYGTGTDTPSPTDTGLQTAVAATLLDVDSASSGNSLQLTHTVASTIANGSTLTEYELRFSDGTSLNRTLNGGIIKTSSIEIVTITTLNLSRG